MLYYFSGGPDEPGTPDGPDGPPDIPDVIEELFDPDAPLSNFMRNVFEPFGGGGDAAWALLNLVCLILTCFIFLPLHRLRSKFSRGRMMKELNGEHVRLLEAGILRPLDREGEESLAEFREADIDAETARIVAEGGGAVGETEARNMAMSRAEAALDEALKKRQLYYVRRFTRRFRIGIPFELIASLLALITFIYTEDMRLPMVIIDRWTPLMILLLTICWLLDVLLIRHRQRIDIEEDVEVEIEDLTPEVGEEPITV